MTPSEFAEKIMSLSIQHQSSIQHQLQFDSIPLAPVSRPDQGEPTVEFLNGILIGILTPYEQGLSLEELVHKASEIRSIANLQLSFKNFIIGVSLAHLRGNGWVSLESTGKYVLTRRDQN